MKVLLNLRCVILNIMKTTVIDRNNECFKAKVVTGNSEHTVTVYSLSNLLKRCKNMKNV